MDDFEAKIRLARAIHSGDNSNSFLVKNGFIFNFIEKKPIDSLLLENSIWFWLKNTFDHTHYRAYSTQYVVIASIDLIASFGCVVDFLFVSNIFQVKCRIPASCAIERLHFNSHIIGTYRIIPMIDHIAVRFADVPSKSYQHYTIIKESIAVKNRSNVKHAVRIRMRFQIHFTNASLIALLFSLCLSVILELDSICHIEVVLMPIYFFNSVIHSLLN